MLTNHSVMIRCRAEKFRSIVGLDTESPFPFLDCLLNHFWLPYPNPESSVCRVHFVQEIE